MATTSPSATHQKPEAHTMPAMRRTVVGLHLFNAVSAVGGGIALVEGFSWLQGLYLLTGTIAVVASLRLSQAERSHTNQEVLR